MMMRALLAVALLGPSSASAFAQDVWSLSRDGGTVAFVARHFGIPTASGRFGTVDGTIALDFDRPERSRIRMTIQTASLRTGADLVDGFIKGQTMLDVAHYPVASFVSQQVARTGERSLSITGQLTIRGASQPVTVIAVAESDPAGMRAGGTLPFHASASFSRAAFAIGREVNIVDDQVEIDIKGVISR
ncbi:MULTISPECIES: YceI family protein [Bosea]|uniref:Polyisoprenoid-binding protein YceI n=1 Tax=Bosea robiniae TaxID=1036780 RepID=A0ABY0NQD3_9HYPH|nr:MULTISPECIES: YceI family protein [Bosea]TQI75866.1 polyisoprenoid-binding protein YceI [Bosea sp. AK1]SDF60829.1 Polyisoprenoid-binding protein YceI [Bosea robiniae]